MLPQLYVVMLVHCQSVGRWRPSLNVAGSRANFVRIVVGEEASRVGRRKTASAIESNSATSSDQSQRRASEILSFAPRGLSRVQSAAYIGVSPALFDELVGDGRMPQPKKINSRVVWDRKQLDKSFEALPDREDRNPWDEEDAA